MASKNANNRNGRNAHRTPPQSRRGSARHSTSSNKSNGSTATRRSLAKLVRSASSTQVLKEEEAPNLEAIEARIQMLREDSRMATYRINYHSERRANIQEEIRRLKCEAKALK
jgi:hypothetical protein